MQFVFLEPHERLNLIVSKTKEEVANYFKMKLVLYLTLLYIFSQSFLHSPQDAKFYKHFGWLDQGSNEQIFRKRVFTGCFLGAFRDVHGYTWYRIKLGRFDTDHQLTPQKLNAQCVDCQPVPSQFGISCVCQVDWSHISWIRGRCCKVCIARTFQLHWQ